MYFEGTFLRVLTPKTTNGVITEIKGGEVQYREDFLPLTAKKQLEKKNARLVRRGFQHLVAIIEVVGDEPTRPNPRPAVQAPVDNEEVTVTPKKPNPKPRKGKTE